MMGPISFGFSFGDFVTLIKILNHICKAFDQAKGAKKQYVISCGFLRQLIPVLRRIQAQASDETKDEHLRDALAVNAQAISDAYTGFDDYLSRKYNGLSSREPSKAKQMLLTVKWGLDEMHEKVQKLKEKVTVAMEPYQTLLLQESTTRSSISRKTVGALLLRLKRPTSASRKYGRRSARFRRMSRPSSEHGWSTRQALRRSELTLRRAMSGNEAIGRRTPRISAVVWTRSRSVRNPRLLKPTWRR